MVRSVYDRHFDEVYQLAADMGGAELGWRPTEPLRDGLAKTYAWIEAQVLAQDKG